VPVGTYFEPGVFAQIHEHFHFWIWTYRVYLFGMILATGATLWRSGIQLNSSRLPTTG
jgi:hypothetical protein